MRHTKRPIIATCVDHIFWVELDDERTAPTSGEAICEIVFIFQILRGFSELRFYRLCVKTRKAFAKRFPRYLGGALVVELNQKKCGQHTSQ